MTDSVSSSSGDLQHPVDHFLDYLRYEKQVSSHTLSAYQRDLDKTLQQLSDTQLSDWSTGKEKSI